MRNTYTEPVYYESESNYLKKSKNNKNQFRENLLRENYAEENAQLKKELHELRKMQAGWYGKNKNVVKKEILVKNNHYLD